MKSTELLCKALLEEVNSDDQKNIILISGASASGKSYTANAIVNYFNSNGKKTALLSADNYYKGLSRIIVEKSLTKDLFQEFVNDCDEIVKIVKSIIGSADFGGKFSEENILLLQTKLSNLLGEKTESFIQELIYQKDNINYDEPDAIDFNSLTRDINKFSSKESIELPNYSFNTSETNFDGEVISGEDTDVLVVEGIYALKDEILDSIDEDNVIKCAINCDAKTLMSRRFNRDIKQGRTSMSPADTITTFITKVMPAYYRYIKPTMMYVDYALDTSLTQEERSRRMGSHQYKFKTDDAMEYLKKYKAKLIAKRDEVDYFLEDDNFNSDILLRLRCVDGKANSLCFKTGASVENRMMDEYSLSGILDGDLSVNSVVDSLKESGFRIADLVRKNRRIYVINGAVVKLDNIADVGEFIEIDAGQFEATDAKSKINELKTLLRLENSIDQSYLAMKRDIPYDKDSVESERKFKIDLDKSELKTITKGAEKKKIKQYYLDMYNESVQNLLTRTFNRNIQFRDFGEARIRFVNNDRCYLTMKSNGKAHRVEWEKEIPIYTAEDYLQYSVKNLSKTRYIIHEDLERDLVLELDVYKKVPLVILEVEYDSEKENAETIKEYVLNYLSKYNVAVTDVTSDQKYKNKNLANELSEH